MKHPWLSLVWILGLAIPLTLGAGTHVAHAGDGTVLAEYELEGKKQQITLEELEKEISELPPYKQRRYSDAEGKRNYLELMAESRLILEEAKKKKLDQDPEILKKVEEYLHQLMVEKVTEMEVDQKVKPVTEEEMQAYYEEHKEEFVEPERVRLTCIMAQNDEDKAKKWYQQIQEGKDIKELAKELAAKGELKGPGERNEGDTGFFDRDAFPVAPEFTKAAFELKVGELYPGIMPIDVNGTMYYAIFRLEERKPERQKTLDDEDVRKKIRRALEKQHRQERMNEWVSQVREQAKLKLYKDRIPEEKKEEASGETKGSEAKEKVKESEEKAQESQPAEVKGRESKEKESKRSEPKGSGPKESK